MSKFLEYHQQNSFLTGLRNKITLLKNIHFFAFSTSHFLENLLTNFVILENFALLFWKISMSQPLLQTFKNSYVAQANLMYVYIQEVQIMFAKMLMIISKSNTMQR